MKKNVKILIAFSAGILALFTVFHKPLLTRAGAFLIHQDAIEPADAVLVLGGGLDERIFQGLELYNGKYGRKLIFTGQFSPWHNYNWAIAAGQLAAERGVPKKDIILIVMPKSTHDDAVLSKEACERNHIRSIIVTSEPFHTKRAYHSFRKVYEGSGIKVMFYPVQNSWYKKDTWWKSKKGIRQTAAEYLKLAYYMFKGYLK
ncbi:MAG: YdcF family protein [Elusimicrobiota bacterium]